MIRCALLDIAGVLYTGETPIEGAREAFRRLAASGVAVRLVTNTTRSPKRVVLERLRRMGYAVEADQLFTAPEATRAYLRARRLTVYALVHPALEEEFADLTGPHPNAVLIGDAGERFTYARLNAAFRLLMEGAPLLAIAANRYFREADGLSLDAGPFVAALEFAADVRAKLFGKPAPAFFRNALQAAGCAPEQAVMVGDDVEADVNGALAAGMRGILVRTGKYRAGDEQRMDAGGTVVADVAAAVERILAETA